MFGDDRSTTAMTFTTSEDPKRPTVFVLEMIALLFVPSLVMGVGLAAVSGPENFLPGLALGAIVGIGAAKLRNEIRGARLGDTGE
ncbi:hypothetical protein OB955_13155 [Halobacteria archaeon AArc-m2/3/4]|uniref:Uncharacterized protein n=1 Tax=Natronoglomus mannanivorans TaxID=2979990 RepID=A0AAP2YWU9_9EURY|nr:hypothetical protein [Halobacteria archaeon AArc-xg1-1]MCU4973683.1 hypothetical protein [Halobacteria archaeon AArc-m2/3/4]